MNDYIQNDILARFEDFQGSIGIIRNRNAIMYSSNTIDPNKPFRLASISKQFTAFIIWSLIEQDKLSISTKIGDIIDELPIQWHALTIEQLIFHTAGLPHYLDIECITTRKIVDNAYILNEMIHNLDYHELLFQPGSKYEYSNTAYLLLPLLAEKITGLSFDILLDKYIFVKFKMYNSGTIRKYFVKESRIIGVPNDYNVYDGIVGDGGICSTVNDLLIWSNVLFDEKYDSLFVSGKLNTGVNVYDECGGYGWGWTLKSELISNEKNNWYGHGGSWLSFYHYICIDRIEKNAIIVLNNTGNYDVDNIVQYIAENIT